MLDEKPRILIVSGDIVPSFTETQLRSLGFTVAVAHALGEVSEKTKQLSPGLIFVVDGAAGFDSVGAIKALKGEKITAAVPLILVSKFSSGDLHIRALEAGADEFLNDGPGTAELQLRIRSVLRAKAFVANREIQEQSIEAEVGKRTENLKLAFEKIRVASLDTIFRLSRAAE
jgi:putative two-component system response regulator